MTVLPDRPASAGSQGPDSRGPDFTAAARAIQSELVAFRRDLHRNPELGNDLPRTQAAVLRALEGLPLEVHTGTAVSSVTAVLRGTKPLETNPGSAVDRPTVLLRGDMDALPITEETGLDFASVNGNMHACGHDMHTAGLLGAAKLLSDRADELAGDVIFMFQPGEEGPGGAKPMLDEGLLEVSGRKPDAAYAVHVLSSEEAGSWSTRPGPLMAGIMDLKVRVMGKGGHGSTPYGSVDPVPVAAEMVLALQTYVTRRVNVFDPVVITVGQIHAGSASNIIPDTASLHASVRVLSQESTDQLAHDLPRLAQGIASAHGCEAEVDLQPEFPATVNDPAETDFVLNELTALYGEESVTQMPNPRMGSEDFSFVLEQVPGTFVFLGAHPAPIPENPPTNHSPKALFDESVLPDQAATLAHLAYRRING